MVVKAFLHGCKTGLNHVLLLFHRETILKPKKNDVLGFSRPFGFNMVLKKNKESFKEKPT